MTSELLKTKQTILYVSMQPRYLIYPDTLGEVNYYADHAKCVSKESNVAEDLQCR